MDFIYLLRIIPTEILNRFSAKGLLTLIKGTNKECREIILKYYKERFLLTNVSFPYNCPTLVRGFVPYYCSVCECYWAREGMTTLNTFSKIFFPVEYVGYKCLCCEHGFNAFLGLPNRQVAVKKSINRLL